MSRSLAWRPFAALAPILVVLAAASATALAERPPVPDTFTATTTDMTPAGLTLRIDVLRWSDDAARAAVVSALTDDGEGTAALAELPTVGYVWPSESPIGYAVKYAYRMPASGDRERLTFVTDKPVGAYGMKPWATNRQSAPSALDYSVIELYLDAEGSGVGTMSLAADVVFDREAHTVSLAESDTPTNVLTDARVEPEPYWAQGS